MLSGRLDPEHLVLEGKTLKRTEVSCKCQCNSPTVLFVLGHPAARINTAIVEFLSLPKDDRSVCEVF